MKMKDVLDLPGNELSLVLEGLATESEDLRYTSLSEYNGKKRRAKRLGIEKKIAKICREFIIRGWKVEISGYDIKFFVIDDSIKVQTGLE